MMNDDSAAVSATNIPQAACTRECLEFLFQSFGTVVRVDIVPEQARAVISFSSPSEARDCIELSQGHISYRGHSMLLQRVPPVEESVPVSASRKRVREDAPANVGGQCCMEQDSPRNSAPSHLEWSGTPLTSSSRVAAEEPPTAEVEEGNREDVAAASKSCAALISFTPIPTPQSAPLPAADPYSFHCVSDTERRGFPAENPHSSVFRRLAVVVIVGSA